MLRSYLRTLPNCTRSTLLMRRLNLMLLVVVFVVPGCSAEEEEDTSQIHPNRESLTIKQAPSSSIELPAEEMQRIASIDPGREHVLSDLPVSLRLGELEGDPDSTDVFGVIRDAALFDDGAVLLLDGSTSQLFLYDGEGRRLATAGGPGQGPGEFREPRALDLLNDTTALVAGASGNISVFTRQASSLTYRRRFRASMSPLDVCAQSDTVYVMGPSQIGGAVQAYSAQGDSLFTFADLYESGNTLVDLLIQQGKIACMNDTVVVALTTLPYIFVFASDGDLVEFIEIDGFVPEATIVRPSGAVSSEFPEGRSFVHFVRSTVGTGSGNFVLQVGRRTPDGAERGSGYDYLHTYRIELNPLEWEYLGATALEILSGRATGRSGLVGATDRPFPQLFVVGNRKGPNDR